MPVKLEFTATHSKKARNSTKRLPMSAVVDAVLKEEIDIMHPVFRIHCPNNTATLDGVNLFAIPQCYCSQLGRWYWITKVTHITTCVYDIECETDVLATFRDDIKATQAFVEYSASNGNSFVQDNRFPKMYSSRQESEKLDISEFNGTGCFILQAATSEADCNTGLLETYALTSSELKAIASKLYSKDLIQSISNVFTNPSEAIGRCLWLPLQKSEASDSACAVKFNDVTLGTGSQAKKIFSKYFGRIDVPNLHHGSYINASGERVTSWADYRNMPPYTETYIYLPGVGLMELPLQELIGNGNSQPSASIYGTLSIPTGDIIYRVVRNVDNQMHGDYPEMVMHVTGKLGVDIPTSSLSTGMGSALMSAVAFGAATFTMSVAPLSTPFMMGTAISASASAGFNANKSAMSVSGNTGSWANSLDGALDIYTMTIRYDTTDTPWDASSVMGMPLFKHITLNQLSGYVKCSNAFCKTWGTAQEIDRINAYLNGEGVILEE